MPDRILIADDNPSIHRDFYKLLTGDSPDALDSLADAIFGSSITSPQARSFELDSAYQGEEALAMVRASLGETRPYAVTFLDVRMPPGWDGVETLTKIWEVDPRIQVVLCTAYSDYSWQDILDRVGHSDQWLILKKPFEIAEVRQLAHALSTKWQLARENERRLDELERSVAERTHALQITNARLRQEIAERERAERELRQAQRLEALGRLSAGIGHEINNPLTYTIASIDAIQDELTAIKARLPDESYRDICELLEAANIGTDRITQIVRNIKMFARPSEDSAESIDINAAITLAVKLVEAEISEQIELVLDLGNVPPVLGRRVEVEQVFVNLLKNAAHALADFPGTDCAQHRIQVTSRCSEQRTVLVEVSDTGPGISDEHLDKVFDPFFTTKPVNQGSGLGLSICHTIVQGLNGNIEVHSKESSGTVVRVILPAMLPQDTAIPARANPVAARPESADHRRGRILVVDDEPLILRAIKRSLRGHEVIAVTSGREALALCGNESFDVILCDLMMAGISGMDFYELVKESYSGMEQRIIFITGGTLIADVQAFLARVPNECMEKPIDISVLKDRIEQRMRERESCDHCQT